MTNINKIKIIENVLTDEEILSIINNHDVINNRKILELSDTNTVRFYIDLNENIKNKLINNFNLPNLRELTKIPIRWIRYDTEPHMDFTSNPDEKFENTYLLYLTDSIGNLVINNNKYDIKKNIGYIFNEGMVHETVDTLDTYRLMLGPMNEFGVGVGAGPPLITSLDVNNGSTLGGTNVEITGSDFYNIGIVLFGSINASSFTVNSNTSISAVSPPGYIGTVHITLYNPSYKSSSITTDDEFTYISYPSIITQPISQTVINNSNVSFSIEAIGTNTLFYQWYYNSNIIQNATLNTYTTIANQNAGNYYVIISDGILPRCCFEIRLQ